MRRLAVASTEAMAVRRDHHLDQRGVVKSSASAEFRLSGVSGLVLCFIYLWLLQGPFLLVFQPLHEP
jgi:hypothetical protein